MHWIIYNVKENEVFDMILRSYNEVNNRHENEVITKFKTCFTSK